MEQTIMISIEEYKGLLKDSIVLQLLADKAKSEEYIPLDEIRKVLGVKFEGKED